MNQFWRVTTSAGLAAVTDSQAGGWEAEEEAEQRAAGKSFPPPPTAALFLCEAGFPLPSPRQAARSSCSFLSIVLALPGPQQQLDTANFAST